MPEDIAAAPVMDAPVETPASAAPSSTAAPQADAAPSTPPDATPADAKQPEAPDWRERAKSDPDFQAFLREEANRIAQKQAAKAAKAEQRRMAQQAVQQADADTALSLAERIAAEPDEDEAATHEFRQKEQVAKPRLDVLVADPDYKKLWNREGERSMNERYAKDPVAYAGWVHAEIKKLAAAEAVKAALPTIKAALKTEMDNARLLGQPVPPMGGGTYADDAAFVAAYARGDTDDHARYRKLRERLT